MDSSLGPHEEYRYVLIAAANLLNILAEIIETKQTKHLALFYGIERPEVERVTDPVYAAGQFAQTIANCLDDFGPDDERGDLFDQLELAAVSISNLVIMLRVFAIVG